MCVGRSAKSYLPATNKVQIKFAMLCFTPIFIPDKSTHDFQIIVNPMHKNLNFFFFFFFLSIHTKQLGKVGLNNPP